MGAVDGLPVDGLPLGGPPLDAEAAETLRDVLQDSGSYFTAIDRLREDHGVEVPWDGLASLAFPLGSSRPGGARSTLVPWVVRAEHRTEHALAMLLVEGRRRRGGRLHGTALAQVGRFLGRLADDDLVVDYDPVAGFSLVPRGPGDRDLVREPPTWR